MIHIGFVDDWEVRGNGTGDPRVLQFEPMRKLVKIFNAHGIRGSFNAEVMQQLTYRCHEARFPELKPIADEWEEVVTGSFRQATTFSCTFIPNGWGPATKDAAIGSWAETVNPQLSTAADAGHADCRQGIPGDAAPQD